MNWKPEQSDGEPDCLDRLLAEVRWEEPRPEAIRRLSVQWRTLMERRSRRRRRRLFALATAAALAGVGLMVWEILGRGALQPKLENDGMSSPLIAVQGTNGAENSNGDSPIFADHRYATVPAKIGTVPPSPLVVAEPAPRRPNAYEIAMLAAGRRTHRDRQRYAVSEQPKPLVPAVEPPVCVLARTYDSPKLGRLICMEQDPAQRQVLLSELLSRNNMSSVCVFLDRAEDPRTSDAAFESLAGAANLPIEMFFQCLRSPMDSRRTAAARVLGRLDRPEITQQLIAMVNRGTYRREAMVALLSSSEPTARQYLACAERDQMLAATLWNAKRNFQTSVFWRNDYATSRPSS